MNRQPASKQTLLCVVHNFVVSGTERNDPVTNLIVIDFSGGDLSQPVAQFRFGHATLNLIVTEDPTVVEALSIDYPVEVKLLTIWLTRRWFVASDSRLAQRPFRKVDSNSEPDLE
ncbi:MAG: hypothetical protein O2856_03695 [Planctomycetota bacterium]|nr:hypothetical protein [Planctomycetota bacterium]